MGCLGNILWIIFGGAEGALAWFLYGCLWSITIVGIPMAVGHFLTGCLLCITIIGIPFGLQQFKLAKLALMPFGTSL